MKFSACFVNVSSEYTIDDTPWSRNKTRVFKSKDQDSTSSVVKRNQSSNLNRKNYGIKDCSCCGDASHRFSECTFRESSNHANNIIALNKNRLKRETR